jgi:deoxyuridine 5'-triphosphate nucleotidohydrolase
MRTGLSFGIPEGYVGIVKDRSGYALEGLTTRGGVIDADFIGETRVILQNNTKSQVFRILAGERGAQIIFIPIYQGRLREIAPIHNQDPNSRGTRGFGSTGLNAVRPKQITNLQDGRKEEGKFTYKMGEGLLTRQQEEIHRLFRQYEDILATSFENIKGNTPFKHDIDTGDAEPIKQKPYQVPVHYRQWVSEEIQALLKSGLIERSNSPWASPIVIVPKKTTDGTYAPRMVQDYRKVNKKSKKDGFPLPRIDAILAGMQHEPRYFTSMDLFMGYNQIGLTDRAKERSAFVTENGHYQYTRMPFGMCGAPATFQRTMTKILEDMIGKCVYVYIDDIAIYTSTFEKHMVALREVLKRLRKNGLYLKPKKCTIAAPSIELLGHVIDRHGIRMSQSKISAIKDYPVPKDRASVRALMGTFNYYRSFIPQFSKIAAPINACLAINKEFEWTLDAQVAFEVLKKKLCEEPILARPDFTKPFILQTDACKTGLGAVLCQKLPVTNDKGETVLKERVICYGSVGTNKHQRNYSATKLELLAVVWALKTYRHYLLGAEFRLESDHRAFVWLLNQTNVSGVMARWIMAMQEYDINLVYKPGVLNSNVDGLSRTPRVRFEEKLSWDMCDPLGREL